MPLHRLLALLLTATAPCAALAQRRAEHKLLASAEWPALVERMDIDLQPMSRLLAGRARW